MIKVVVADDQTIVREGLSLVLSFDEEVEVVFEAKNGQEVLDYLATQTCDVVLMDIKMPVLNGVETTAKIREKNPKVKILILTTFNDYDYIFQALKNGANGYLLKDATSQELLSAIKKVVNNEAVLGKEVSTQIVSGLREETTTDKKVAALSEREFEIAKLLAKGKSNREISGLLFLSEGTVKNYLTSIFAKLELTNRTEVAVFMKKYD